MASTFTGTVSRVSAVSARTSVTRMRWSTYSLTESTIGMTWNQPGPAEAAVAPEAQDGRLLPLRRHADGEEEVEAEEGADDERARVPTSQPRRRRRGSGSDANSPPPTALERRASRPTAWTRTVLQRRLMMASLARRGTRAVGR